VGVEGSEETERFPERSRAVLALPGEGAPGNGKRTPRNRLRSGIADEGGSSTTTTTTTTAAAAAVAAAAAAASVGKRPGNDGGWKKARGDR